MPSRRTFLGTITGISLTTAGCLSENSTPPSLGEVTVLNTRDQSTTVSTTITKGGETVHDREVMLEARQNSSVDGASITESWMGSGTDFKIEVDAPSVETEVFSTIEFEEEFNYEFDCVPLTIYIQDSAIEIQYGMNGCSEF
jgi:hypothetical protein